MTNTEEATVISRIFGTNHFQPENIIFQNVGAKEKVGKRKKNRLRDWKLFDTLTLVDIQEIVSISGTGGEIYETVILWKKIELKPRRKLAKNYPFWHKNWKQKELRFKKRSQN